MLILKAYILYIIISGDYLCSFMVGPQNVKKHSLVNPYFNVITVSIICPWKYKVIKLMASDEDCFITRKG